MKDKYRYPAIFEYAEDGINVSFPDLPGALTCGDTTEEALEMAKECLELYLYSLEEDGEPIPKPSEVQATKKNEKVMLIGADMLVARFAMKSEKQKITRQVENI